VDLAGYLLAGGFFFGNLRGQAEDGLRSHEEELDHDHPLFSCYYNLPEAVGSRQAATAGKQGTEAWARALAITGSITGYYVQGRLAGVSGNPSLSWDPPTPRNGPA
jgi:hypothetical protein